MNAFDYERAASLEEALARIGAGAQALAGGTDLLTLMKAGLAAPERLVDVKRTLPRCIELRADGLAIGAGATLAEIERHPGIREEYSALAQACSLAASMQIRNLATLGGNLLQRPRCWYFRDARTSCWLKGGEHCLAHDGENRNHALFGGGPCWAVHPSDPAAALLAFDAGVRLAGPKGERSVPLEQLLTLPSAARRTETALEPNELLLGVRLAPAPPGMRSVYLKAMDRSAFSFALVGVAAALRISGGRVAHARLVLSGVGPIPWRLPHAEAVLHGAPPSEERFEAAAGAALQGATPLRHNGYKVPLARALLKKALRTLQAEPNAEKRAG
jgi:xanthine dehydrogenase YagS FAD-binding subunit